VISARREPLVDADKWNGVTDKFDQLKR